MVDRIKFILESKNLTSSQFANLIGVQRSGISHVLSGRNKPSLDFIIKILNHFPEISEKWLLKGEGVMNKAETQHSFASEKELQPKIEFKNKDQNKNSDDSNPTKSDDYKGNDINESSIANIIKESEDRIEKIIIIYNDQTFETLSKRK